MTVPRNITYSYFDYRGEFKVEYDNPVLLIQMNDQGTTLLSSQVIMDDPNFECGPAIPTQPEDVTIFGGKQNMLSNSLLKSSVRYILTKGYFNIKLNQQNWESRAFQFYAGDLYMAIPSLKKVNAETPIAGECKAFNDDSFNFSVKSDTQYLVNLNYSCSLNMTNTTIIQFTILTANVINVTLGYRELGFKIHSIAGTPVFEEISGYKIENSNFAKFLVSETLKVATGSPVFGTGYKTNQREHPVVKIRPDYLFMYDPSYIPHGTAI